MAKERHQSKSPGQTAGAKKDTKVKALSKLQEQKKTPKMKRLTLRLQPNPQSVLEQYMKKHSITTDTKAINRMVEQSIGLENKIALVQQQNSDLLNENESLIARIQNFKNAFDLLSAS